MSRNRGFSLTEVLLSMVLLTVLAMGVMSSFSYLKSGSLRYGDAILVSSILQQKMTELKSIYTAEGTLQEVISTDPEAVVADFPIGTVPKLTVVGNRSDGGEKVIPGGLRLVTATLNWVDTKGKSRTVALNSFFFKE